VADPRSVKLQSFDIRLETTRHLVDGKLPGGQISAVLAEIFDTVLYRKAQYAPDDIVVNLIARKIGWRVPY
jgi:hypothetical protein